MELTAAALKKAEFKGPVAFYDYDNGGARQDFECVDEPRFGYFWKRENRKDRGRQAYMVDGKEVANLDEAARLLTASADPESPREAMRRSHDEFMESPSLNYGATRALSEARCNADAGPFGMIRAWLHRSDHPWHTGINRYSEQEREAGKEWPSWLYTAKSSAHEISRMMYLFAADRKDDTELACGLGVKCRNCSILKTIETDMIASRDRKPFSYAVEDFDIDAAKAWTCMCHVLTQGGRLVDGTILTTKRDRSHSFF